MGGQTWCLRPANPRTHLRTARRYEPRALLQLMQQVEALTGQAGPKPAARSTADELLAMANKALPRMFSAAPAQLQEALLQAASGAAAARRSSATGTQANLLQRMTEETEGYGQPDADEQHQAAGQADQYADEQPAPDYEQGISDAAAAGPGYSQQDADYAEQLYSERDYAQQQLQDTEYAEQYDVAAEPAGSEHDDAAYAEEPGPAEPTAEDFAAYAQEWAEQAAAQQAAGNEQLAQDYAAFAAEWAAYADQQAARDQDAGSAEVYAQDADQDAGDVADEWAGTDPQLWAGASPGAHLCVWQCCCGRGRTHAAAALHGCRARLTTQACCRPASGSLAAGGQTHWGCMGRRRPPAARQSRCRCWPA